MTAVNFSRWLHRLGFKSGEGPGTTRSVQPVSIVADQRGLVSPALGPSYIVGGTTPANAGQVAGFSVQTPVPIRASVTIGHPGAANLSTSMRIGVGAIPAAAATLGTLALQRFDDQVDPALGLWQQTRYLAPVVGPTIVLFAGGTVDFPDDVWIPAGGWMVVTGSLVNNALSYAVRAVEYPADLAR